MKTDGELPALGEGERIFDALYKVGIGNDSDNTGSSIRAIDSEGNVVVVSLEDANQLGWVTATQSGNNPNSQTLEPVDLPPGWRPEDGRPDGEDDGFGFESVSVEPPVEDSFGDDSDPTDAPVVVGPDLPEDEPITLQFADEDSVEISNEALSSLSEVAPEPLVLGELLDGVELDGLLELLSLNFDGTDTTVELRGTSGEVSQQFVLQGFDPTGLGESEQDILAKMIEDGMLKIDT